MAKQREKASKDKVSKEATESSVSVDAPVEKKVIPTDTFEADGVEYRFVCAEFILNGKTVKAVDAIEDEDILAQLVEMKAGVITVVE